MTEQQLFELMKDASPFFLVAAALILLIFRLPGIMDKYVEVQKQVGDTERQRVQGLEAVQERAMDAVRLAVESMKQAQTESRAYYMEKMEAMRSGLSIVEGRVRDLENQLEDKDRRIKEQEERIRELERENADKDKVIEGMQGEMAELKRKLALKEARKSRTGETVTVPAAGD